MTWQPIETAPKDGTVIVLWCPHGVPNRAGYESEKFPFTFGSWTAGERSNAQWQSTETILEYHDYGGMTGMSTWTENLPCDPTHWQPLPPPPQGSDE